jgi:hypothetical protein
VTATVERSGGAAAAVEEEWRRSGCGRGAAVARGLRWRSGLTVVG